MNQSIKCTACRNGKAFDVPITMAFQPIVSISTGQVFAYEALVRGLDERGAVLIFEAVSDQTIYAFDQKCRVTAIEWADRLGVADTGALLSINFLPNAVYNPTACIQLTLEAAERTGFPVDQIMFEFTESERIDTIHLLGILEAYRDLGFHTAIDDFGAGYAGLDLLARFQPDIVKLDMELIRDIDTHPAKFAILRHLTNMMHELNVRVICEGIETTDEALALMDCGIDLMQGFLFAQPAFQSLPQVTEFDIAAAQRAGFAG
ncbi:MAG: EAL domain-containing protein [Pseudomonadota bacterium]